jgi:hypothetical protein
MNIFPIAPALALILCACVASGAPSVRSSPRDGEGQLIAGCRNVSPSSRVETYDTRFYHTTYGSAWVEGTSNLNGLGEGGVAQAIREAMGEPTIRNGRTYYELPMSLRPYCRAYDADRALVAGVVAQILPQLGNPVERSDVVAGVFKTGRSHRSHAMARWQDDYAIAVYSLGPGQTAVWVYRDIYISRPGMGEQFDQAISSGRNETWIFTRINDALAVGR